jgi:hypothetical protein
MMKRLPIIRHMRAMLFCYCCNRHYDLMRDCGFSLGGWNDAELQHWEDITAGRA